MTYGEALFVLWPPHQGRHKELPQCYASQMLALGNHGQECLCLKVLLFYLMVKFLAQTQAHGENKEGGQGGMVAEKEDWGSGRSPRGKWTLTWISSGGCSRRHPRGRV